MRLVIVASKPTDAVTHGFVPAADRLGLEVLLLTDQPEATVVELTAGPAIPAELPYPLGFLMNDLLADDLSARVLLVHLGEPLPPGPPPVRPGHTIADFVLAERSGVPAAALVAQSGVERSAAALRSGGRWEIAS